MADKRHSTREQCFRPKNSRNQNKSLNKSNIPILLNINKWNVILAIPFTKTLQIENITHRLLDYAPSIGGHGGHFKMAANIKVGFIFCRYGNSTQVLYFLRSVLLSYQQRDHQLYAYASLLVVDPCPQKCPVYFTNSPFSSDISSYLYFLSEPTEDGRQNGRKYHKKKQESWILSLNNILAIENL